MTSALPAFVDPLSRIMTTLNQNVVKLETSDAFTFLERQVLAMVHRVVYGLPPAFYAEHVQQADRGADLDFLRGCRGSAVPRESH